MNRNEAQAFEEILDGVCEALGRERLSKTAKRLWWNAMSEVTLEQFETAATQYLHTSKGQPTIAAFNDLLHPSQYPAPEEAWNMAPKSEYDGGWVCDELMAALGACQDSLDRGDMVAARMAFLERYRVEIQGKVGEPRWWLSRPIGQTETEKMAWEENAMLTAPASAQTASLHLAQMRKALTQSGSSATALPSRLASELSGQLSLARKISSRSSGEEVSNDRAVQ